MIKINQVKLPVMASVRELKPICAKMLKLSPDKIESLEILRRSIDARKKPDIYFSYTVLLQADLGKKTEEAYVAGLRNRDISCQEREVYHQPELKDTIAGMPKEEFVNVRENRPIVVGFGPAGMFAALILARSGLRPIVYERGQNVEQRMKDVEDLWNKGELHKESNPQFGEGGAGTFSDGKLNTLTKDKDGRNRYILNKFVALGADPAILIDAKPHVGTDCLVSIVKGIRQEIEALGGEIHFNTQFHYEGQKNVILAIGHSSRDTYQELFDAGVHMEAKDFAMGFRVQHPQEMINKDLYGEVSEEVLQRLGQGAYKITHTCKANGRGVYSFCMCPGGYVVNSSSEEGHLCVNGMSYHARDSRNANAAIIVSIRKTDYHGEENPLGGIALQREVERRAYCLQNGKIPVQTYHDFVNNVATTEEKMKQKTQEIQPVIRGQYAYSTLNSIFQFEENSPYAALNDFNESFVEGMESFEHKLHGFSRPDTLLCGVEARTSSPVRIPRNENFMSNLEGLYPCGEGAGYAGGIMSAAMDGMKTAEALVKHYNSL